MACKVGMLEAGIDVDAGAPLSRRCKEKRCFKRDPDGDMIACDEPFQTIISKALSKVGAGGTSLGEDAIA